jgi:hypothetical protein
MLVIPAEAGIPLVFESSGTPAFAGVTIASYRTPLVRRMKSATLSCSATSDGGCA